MKASTEAWWIMDSGQCIAGTVGDAVRAGYIFGLTRSEAWLAKAQQHAEEAARFEERADTERKAEARAKAMALGVETAVQP